MIIIGTLLGMIANYKSELASNIVDVFITTNKVSVIAKVFLMTNYADKPKLVYS